MSPNSVNILENPLRDDKARRLPLSQIAIAAQAILIPFEDLLLRSGKLLRCGTENTIPKRRC